eukprot:587368-Hanusia_phi.AAC.1
MSDSNSPAVFELRKREEPCHDRILTERHCEYSTLRRDSLFGLSQQKLPPPRPATVTGRGHRHRHRTVHTVTGSGSRVRRARRGHPARPHCAGIQCPAAPPGCGTRN